MKMPKILHQIWTGNVPVPPQFSDMLKTWESNNPSWQYEFWDRKRIDDFFANNYHEIKNADRPDIARFFILKHYGGLYVGFDFEAIESMDSLFATDEFYLSRICDNRGISEAFIACPPAHPFIKFITDDISKSHNNELWNSRVSLADYYKRYEHKDEISVLDSKYLYPCSQEDLIKYKSERITDEEMEEKLTDAIAICYYFEKEQNALSADVLYISTGDGGGGAWIAAHRIHSGLRKIGLESKMFVKQSSRARSSDIIVASPSEFDTTGKPVSRNAHTISRRATQSIQNVLFSTSSFGIDLQKYLDMVNPKIVQMHCINWGFLTIEDLRLIKNLSSGDCPMCGLLLVDAIISGSATSIWIHAVHVR